MAKHKSSFDYDDTEWDEFEEYRRKSYSAGNLLKVVQTRPAQPQLSGNSRSYETLAEDEEPKPGFLLLQPYLSPLGYRRASSPAVPRRPSQARGACMEAKMYKTHECPARCLTSPSSFHSASSHIQRKYGVSQNSSVEDSDDGASLVPPKLQRQRSRSLPFNRADFGGVLQPSSSDGHIFQCRRVRRFSMASNKGLVNLGDRVDLTKVSSLQGSSLEEQEEECAHLYYDPDEKCLKLSNRRERIHGVSDDHEVLAYKTLLIGAHGVGKSALTRQFLTSEYVGYVDPASPAPGDPEEEDIQVVSVPVLLNKKAYKINVIRAHDLRIFEVHPDSELCVVMYAVDQEGSFFTALEIVKEIRSWEEGGHKKTNIVLVGNKVDLVRNTVILPSQGKEMAATYDCKFMEISVALNHQVDELLVAMLKLLKKSTSKTNKLCEHTAYVPKKKDKSKKLSSLFSNAFSKASSKLMKSCDDLLLTFK